MAGFGAGKPAGGKGKAGFGSKAKAPKKKELVAPKRQWDSYTRLTEAGAKPVKCFARDGAKDGDEWMLVGNLAIAAADGSAEQAAQYQKRLILEHAARMSPRLKVAQATLEVGLEVLGEPTKLVKPDSMPDTLTCGFVGEPDVGGFYSKVNRNVRDMSAKGAAPGTDSKGRIGA